MTPQDERVAPLAPPEVLFELARGGMGTVYLARTVGLGGFTRFVIVKRLGGSTDPDPALQARFISEARVAAHFHHANVIGTHQVGSDEHGLYMVLDYVEGGSLGELVDRATLRGEQLEIPVLLRIALDVLAGLEAVHRATDEEGEPLCIVHRDVSTQNVLVGRDGIARLADFGIAKGARPSVATKTGSVIGKLLYLPPEYIRREPLQPTTDIYMLGITLWCAITGDEPWRADDEGQLLHQILNGTVPSLASSLAQPVAEEIEALVSRACHPNPRERFQSAKSMSEAIERLGHDRGWVANQSSVAATVETLLGVDLDRRRERVLRVVRARAHTEVDPGTPASTAEEREAEPSTLTPAERSSWTPTTVRSVIGALLVVALVGSGVAAFLVLDSGGSVHSPASVPPKESAPPPPVSITVAVPTPPLARTHAIPPLPSRADTEVPTRPRAERRVPARPKPLPAESADRSAPAPEPAEPPDQISTHNPYR